MQHQKRKTASAQPKGTQTQFLSEEGWQRPPHPGRNNSKAGVVIQKCGTFTETGAWNTKWPSGASRCLGCHSEHVLPSLVPKALGLASPVPWLTLLPLPSNRIKRLDLTIDTTKQSQIPRLWPPRQPYTQFKMLSLLHGRSTPLKP